MTKKTLYIPEGYSIETVDTVWNDYTKKRGLEFLLCNSSNCIKRSLLVPYGTSAEFFIKKPGEKRVKVGEYTEGMGWTKNPLKW